MKKILVPIDFSEVSKNALTYAVKLAAHSNAKVLAVHAYLPSIPEPYLVAAFQDDILENQEMLAIKYFEDIRQALPQEALDQIDLQFKIELGGPIETIMNMVEVQKPDLVVMGMRSGNPIAKKLLGSTTVAMIQRVNVPVMVIPAEASFQSLSHLTFATDLEEGDLTTIELVMEMFRSWKPRLQCVHVQAPVPPIEEQLLVRRLKKSCEAHQGVSSVEVVTVTNEDVSEGILSLVGRRHSDMIILRTHLRGFWGRVLHTSVSRELSRKALVPLLIFPISPTKEESKREATTTQPEQASE